KPYTAVTVQIDHLTSENYAVDDTSGIIDLVDAVQIQATGPTEAARALRKKLKYGDVHRQLRALTILDLLIQNAGDHFTRNFADEPLLERLRIAGSDITTDPQVRRKCQVLFAQWSTLKHVQGMSRVAALYSQLPRKQKPTQERKKHSKVLRETEYSPSPVGSHDGLGHSVSISGGNSPGSVVGYRNLDGSSSGSKKSKKDKHDKHQDHSRTHSRSASQSIGSVPAANVRETLANARIAADGLINALRLVNREQESISENPEIMKRFNECKSYRRQVLKYIHGVTDENYLGSLLNANEELVNALMSFEVLEKSIDDDSDSEVETWTPYDENSIDTSMAGLSLKQQEARKAPLKPPRPGSQSPPKKGKQVESEDEDEEEDEDNPFGDKNAV
ncbi:putative actin patch assembly and actin polymerization protein, partial [Ascosphaera atra]